MAEHTTENDRPPACPDHGATARNNGSCMVRGCRYGRAVTRIIPPAKPTTEESHE